MEVITLESKAFEELKNKIETIEKYVKSTTELFIELDDKLELTSREIMDTLNISKSTLYRWRKYKKIPYRYEDSGNVLYSFKGLVLAIKKGDVQIRNINKPDLLTQLADFRENIIRNSF